MGSYLQDFLNYLEASPCVYHAAKETGMRLAEHDFEPLVEQEDWHLEKNKGYFLIKDESAVIAFKMPKKAPKRAILLASHLDSPALKIRPDFTSPSSDTTQLGVEIYGGPILNTWFNTDLGVAGRIVYTDSKDKMHSKLINFQDFPLIMPQLPIHLDREVND